MLAFAACMREHGVDMPDPDLSGGGGGGFRIGGPRRHRPGQRDLPPGTGGVPATSSRTRLPGSRGGGRETEEGEPQ